MERRPLIRPVLSTLLLVLATRASAQVDLSGVYVGGVASLLVSCRLTFVQKGNTLTITGPCGAGTSEFTFDLTGIVYPTGDFAARGQLIGLCETPPLQASLQGRGDGQVFAGTGGCNTTLFPISGTKCGNGTVDSSEDCEDGNTEAGDCCSPLCTFEELGSECRADRDSCTLDHCDGAGACVHPPAPPGTECQSDFDLCTLDVCDDAGACTHPLAPAGTICEPDIYQCTLDVCDEAGECIHPNRSGACDDNSDCTIEDHCAEGECVGEIVEECVGAADLSGAWEVDLPGPVGGLRYVRRFEQEDALLRSIGPEDKVGFGSINAATGEFQIFTFFIAFIAECAERIDATLSEDGEAFSGTQFINCGAFGTFGPFDIHGWRCPSVEECACDTEVSCIPPDDRSRVAIHRRRFVDLPARWRWSGNASDEGFADPTADAAYRVCIGDGRSDLLQVARDRADWRATGNGFVYAPMSGDAPGGAKRPFRDHVHRLTLKSTASRTVIAASFNSAWGLPIRAETALRIRLLQRTAEGTICYESEFSEPSISTRDRYRAKLPPEAGLR